MTTENFNGYIFEMPPHAKSIIKVLGVGGGGSNAVNHMYKQGIKGVELIVANTDLQALNSSNVHNKLQIGVTLTEGLGCGAKPEVGREAAVESKEQIRDALMGAKMLFITAGMGGGTGTGAAPEIAKIAKSMDILTVGIVTFPFNMEGPKKIAQAKEGIKLMRDTCDTVLIVMNDKLKEIYGNLSFKNAFLHADSILTNAAKGIAEIITHPGEINVDFQDVCTVLRDAGGAVMGSAIADGEDRALMVIQKALESPLLDNHDIRGADKILLSITSSDNDQFQMRMDEFETISEYIKNKTGGNALIIFGHTEDPAMEEKISLTIIATGFKLKDNTSEDATVGGKEMGKTLRPLDEKPSQAVLDLTETVNIPPAEMKLKSITPIEEEILSLKNDLSMANKEFSNNVLEIPDGVSKESSLSDEKQANHGLKDKSLGASEQISQPVDGDKFILVDAHTESAESNELSSDQVSEATRRRLEKERLERQEKIKKSKEDNMSNEDFNERWTIPAFVRQRVKLGDTPHSSDLFVSRYNLSEDNGISNNNKFLHDNVD